MTAALEAALVKAREKLLSGHLSEAQVAKSRGKRAWIATSAEELFPGRPDFQGSEVTDVGAGWLVGTQMSAQVEMPKRVEAACACVGLIFGKDLIARFL